MGCDVVSVRVAMRRRPPCSQLSTQLHGPNFSGALEGRLVGSGVARATQNSCRPPATLLGDAGAHVAECDAPHCGWSDLSGYLSRYRAETI